MNLSLFEKPSHPDAKPAVKLWPHQERAVAGVREKFAEHRSTLAVICTGGGKTILAKTLIDETPGRCLFLVNRDQLLQQAANELGKSRRVGIEKASNYAEKADEVVVATVQSIGNPGRLARWPRDTFDLMVCDEAHASISPSWRRVVDHFETAKIHGLTATPDRTDRRALGEVYESVAIVYDILDGITDGVLVPIISKVVKVNGLHLDDVKTTDGDLDNKQMDAQLMDETVLDEIARPLAIDRIAGDRRGLIFTSTVAHAHALCGRLNFYVPNSARVVDGGMLYPERNANLAAHRSGEAQWLLNCQMLIEGYDDRGLECVVNTRPTKSRLRYAQQVGRGTRSNPGSDKRNLLVIDFTGVSKRHKLITPVDILAGKYSDEVQDEAAAQRQRRVTFTTEQVDPFGAVGIEDPGPDGYGGQFGAGVPASEKQQKMLAWKGFPESMRKGLTKAQASALISKTIGRETQGFVYDPRWMATLRRAGLDPKPMRNDVARKILGHIWEGQPLPVWAEKYRVGTTHEREPGEDDE